MVDNWSDPLTVEEMYGEWDYEAAVKVLERSLSPRRASSIFDTVASLGIGADDVVLDIGGRDASHGLLMAERFGCRVVSVDPAPANIEAGIKAISEHDKGSLVDVRLGAIEKIPAGSGEFDLVFSRDMIGHVADLDQGLTECRRVLIPGGPMLVHGVFATELMEPQEAGRLYAECAVVPERMSAAAFEEAAASAGFKVESLDLVGSEWYEASQEAGVAPNYALQISRLRRAKAAMLEELGEFAYRSMYANALWGVYLLIGKLETRLYVLRRSSP
jgi:cyclopropane fatty-acyl-phospholipid synthase-like methyltransferase